MKIGIARDEPGIDIRRKVIRLVNWNKLLCGSLMSGVDPGGRFCLLLYLVSCGNDDRGNVLNSGCNVSKRAP